MRSLIPWAARVALLAVGCVPPIPDTDAACPCSAGYFCGDEGICALGAEPTDASMPDVGPAEVDAGPSIVHVCGEGVAEDLLQNSGFETRDAYVTLPDGPGWWAGDITERVETEAEVTALEGELMLAFRSTGHETWGPFGASSQVFQIVDLRAHRVLTEAGARVLACASFNRVAGDSRSDRKFVLRVHGYRGEPSTFPFQFGEASHEFAALRSAVLSDAQPETWERVCIDQTLPAPIDFAVVEVRIDEDVVDDPTAPEFDGHFVDDTCLALVPSAP